MLEKTTIFMFLLYLISLRVNESSANQLFTEMHFLKHLF